MAVSDGERDYMRRIGEAKAASHADATARHRARSLGERLEASWALADLAGLALLPSLDWSYVERWAREWGVLDRLQRLRATGA